MIKPWLGHDVVIIQHLPGGLEILMVLEIPREYASVAYDNQSLEYIESFVG